MPRLARGPAASKPRGSPLHFILLLEAAAARARWPTGQPRNGYLTKSDPISKDKPTLPIGDVNGLILAPLSLSHQLDFNDSMSGVSWALLPLMKSVGKEGSALFLTLHFISNSIFSSKSSIRLLRDTRTFRDIFDPRKSPNQ